MTTCESINCEATFATTLNKRFCSMACYQANYRATKRGPESGYWKRYHAEHREERKQQSRENYDRHRDAYLAAGRKWAEENRERMLDYFHEYNATRRNPRTTTAEERRHLAATEARRRDRLTAEVNPAAVRKRMPWTNEEDAIASDMTLTTAQAAVLLGRTWQAVQSRRYNLRKQANA